MFVLQFVAAAAAAAGGRRRLSDYKPLLQIQIQYGYNIYSPNLQAEVGSGN